MPNDGRLLGLVVAQDTNWARQQTKQNVSFRYLEGPPSPGVNTGQASRPQAGPIKAVRQAYRCSSTLGPLLYRTCHSAPSHMQRSTSLGPIASPEQAGGVSAVRGSM